MAWYEFWKTKQPVQKTKGEPFEIRPENHWLHNSLGPGYSSPNPIVYDIYDGEKTPGELGAIHDTHPDHIKLRLRAYEMNLKTDIVKIITNKFFKWVIGTGLKLQSEPNENVLNVFGYKEDLKTLRQNAEALFNLFATTDYADYNRKDDLHQKAADAFETAFLGGDVLCVLRFTETGPNIQVIDGQRVSNPLDNTAAEGDENENKNEIKHGIELNKKGDHVAFWVEQDVGDSIEHERIEARNSNGNLVAWMVYGNKARPDHLRGIPVISQILEKISKLDRFVEASVKKAEETANVIFALTHKTNSTGENVFATSLNAKVEEDGSNQDEESIEEKNGRTANYLRQSTSGTVINMPIDSDIKSLSNDGEKNFEQFFRAVFCALCAAVDIPEEVALQRYEQNYSSSRAAINGWEFLVEVYRTKFANKFYKLFYKAWFEFQILEENLKSKHFLDAKKKKNFMAIEAYFACRWLGKKMPHIDPLKEAKAIRALLGNDGTPLINHEQATELMNGGDWYENIKKYNQELKEIPEDVNSQNTKPGKELDKPAKDKGE